MKLYLVLGLAVASLALPTPQENLPDLGDITEIFRTSSRTSGNSGTVSSRNGVEPNSRNSIEPSSRSSVDVLVQVLESDKRVKGDNSPGDYFNPDKSEYTDEVRVEVDSSGQSCTAYADQGYTCVPYYQCRNGSIITDGSGLIDVRNGFAVLDVEVSKCPGFLDVCCKDPDFVPPPPPPRAIYRPQCGRRNVYGLGARIKGFRQGEAQFGEWPHMCAVLKGDTVSGQDIDLYQCGGSLVAPGVVLTAAHCVDRYRDNVSRLKVRCGEWNTQNETEPYPHQDRDVAKVKVHPEYFGGALFNDVALLFTKQEFVLSQHIDTACLPQPEESFVTETCFATGWGKDKFGSSGEYQVVLKEVDIPVVERDSCQESLRNTRLGKRFKLDESFLCAGGEAGKDTCRGDGGSPLVCPSKYGSGSYVQAGIVAWGIGCGETGTPGVYADVSKAVCWMDYAVSCYYGSSISYWGFSSQTCGSWKEGKVADLKQKVNNVKGRAGKIFQNQLDQYQECEVTWSQKTDVSAYGRTIEAETENSNGLDFNNEELAPIGSTEHTNVATDLSLLEKDASADGRTIESKSKNSQDFVVNTETTESKEKAVNTEVIEAEIGPSIIEKNIYTEGTKTTSETRGFDIRGDYSTVPPSIQQEQKSLDISENSNQVYRQ